MVSFDVWMEMRDVCGQQMGEGLLQSHWKKR